MNFYNVLKDYKFDNVGQFNAIARSMGYEVELKGDKFIYRNGKEEETMHIKYIRNNMQPYENGEIKDASRERVSNIFNKDRANDASYIKELEKHNISVIRWENIKGENKDGFTIVDHDLKICYTGQSLYEYASQHGKLLDGKGTRLEKGILSDLMDINGKQGKMRFNENGISVFFRKEVLTIPNEILGKKLSHREKELLLAGDIVPISRNGRDILLQVDKDLNAVIMRSQHEIKIPETIGQTTEYKGYQLTKEDKYLLANGYSLENRLLHSEFGYVIADFRLTADKKGLIFSNIQSITPSKAQEIINAMTSRLEEGKDLKENLTENKAEKTTHNMENEFKQAIVNYNFEKLEQLKDNGYKPSADIINELSKGEKLDEKQLAEIERIFDIDPKPNIENEKVFHTLLKAVQNGDLNIVKEIQSQGNYKLTNDDLTKMREAGIPANTLIAVQKIFGYEEKTKTLGDVKLANAPNPNEGKEMARPITNTINRAFNDL